MENTNTESNSTNGAAGSDFAAALKKKVKGIMTDKIVAAVASILFGVILVVWTGSALATIVRILAVILIAAGAASIIIFFVRKSALLLDTASFVVGVILVLLGIMIAVYPDWLVAVFPVVMGIVIILSGIEDLGETFTLGHAGFGKWWVSLIISAALIALGLFVLFNPLKIAGAIIKVIGIILIINGAADLYVIFCLKTVAKDVRQDVQAVDVEAEEINDPGKQ
ncbi:MAG: DUF308 domain-containing protein [Lachnospiraceae bacterium]|jgi:uncharacterized membrane protein HdeD (DUF308 family)|nr:DUF308 domain-containing protein [Lachnospiraceae bacterium]